MLLKSEDDQIDAGGNSGYDQPTKQIDQKVDPAKATNDTGTTEPGDDYHLHDQSLEALPVEQIPELDTDTSNLALLDPPTSDAVDNANIPTDTIIPALLDPLASGLVNSTNTLTEPNITDNTTGTNPTNGTNVNDQLYSWAGGQNAEEQELVPDEIDSDSALGSDTESETTSLAESIWHFRMEHGRSYHAYKDGKYIFPNDERESDRLDMQHHLLRMTYGNKLFFSPLNKPKRCVDIGTGTGIWAVDFADEYPDCQVLGIDLSPGQPTLVPPNLKFVIDDAEDLWIYEQKFDFIHLRLMAGCFADWPKFFRQAYENLEPGGWLELQDYGLPVKSFDETHHNTDVLRWGELLCEAGRKLGRPLGTDCSDNYLRWMDEAGFVDIKQKMFMWPINGWPKDTFMKDLGRWNMVNILDGLEGFCLALLTRGLGWKKQEVDIFVAKISRDLRDKSIHAYFPMPVAYGRKPYPGEVAFS